MKISKSYGVSLMNMLLCISVLVIHLSAAPATTLIYGSIWHITVYSVNRALSYAVPGFIFLCGFKLFYGYADKDINILRFYLGRAKKVVLPYIIAVFVFFVYYRFMGWASISGLPEYIFLGTLASHFYYIVIAVQFYLLFPILKKLFLRAPIIFCTVSLIVNLFYRNLVYFKYSDRFILTYIFYFALGMLAAKYRLHDRAKRVLLFTLPLFVIFGAVHIYRQYLVYGGVSSYHFLGQSEIVYSTLAILLIFSLCALVADKSKKICGIASSFERVSYNIYLYHLLPIIVLDYNIYAQLSLSVKQKFFISSAVVFSLAAIYFVCDIMTRRKEQK